MSKPPLDQTGADVDDLTDTQLRGLLLLASASSDLLMEPDSPAQVGELLSELKLPHGETGESILRRATAPDAPIDDLSAIKDLAKQLIEQAGDSLPGEAAKILYHLVVAAAYHRGFDISTRPIAERASTCRRLAAAFQGSPMGDVFLRAAKRQPIS